MKRHMLIILSAVLIALIINAAGLIAQAPDGQRGGQANAGTGFTYQGQLESNGSPVNDRCDFRLSLWSAASDGVQIGSTQTRTNVVVSNGYFTVLLDFGSGAFSGDERWLSISVRCPAGSGAYTNLNPRQALTAVPYAQSLVPGATISGTASLGIVNLRNSSGDGVWVNSAADNGFWVSTAGRNGLEAGWSGWNGVNVGYAERNGIYVGLTAGDGVNVCATGSQGGCGADAGAHGLEVGRAQDNGVHVISAGNDGVRVQAAGSAGVHVESAVEDGVFVCRSGPLAGNCANDSGNHGVEIANPYNNGLQVNSAGTDGVHVGSTGWNGVRVDDAGSVGVSVGQTGSYGLHVNAAGGDGLYVFQAMDDGVAVGVAGRDGMYVSAAAGDGFKVCRTGAKVNCPTSAGAHGIEVGNADDDGVHIGTADDDGIQIGGSDSHPFPRYGLYIPWPGVPETALLVNTADINGEWALSTPDKISAANVTMNSLTLVAQVDGTDALTRGDLAAVAGLAESLPGSSSPLPLVRLADSQTWSGVIGVVESRLVWRLAPGKDEDSTLTLGSVRGPAQPGDYVALTVFGVAEVKVDAVAGVIQPGQRLTAAAQPGHARALRSETLNGMVVTEGAAVIGVALAPADAEKDTVFIFVTRL